MIKICVSLFLRNWWPHYHFGGMSSPLYWNQSWKPCYSVRLLNFWAERTLRTNLFIFALVATCWGTVTFCCLSVFLRAILPSKLFVPQHCSFWIHVVESRDHFYVVRSFLLSHSERHVSRTEKVERVVLLTHCAVLSLCCSVLRAVDRICFVLHTSDAQSGRVYYPVLIVPSTVDWYPHRASLSLLWFCFAAFSSVILVCNFLRLFCGYCLCFCRRTSSFSVFYLFFSFFLCVTCPCWRCRPRMDNWLVCPMHQLRSHRVSSSPSIPSMHPLHSCPLFTT